MTVPSNLSVWQYAGNDLATSFDYTAKIFAESDLVVTVTTVAGVDVDLVLNVDYTVTGEGSDSGGSVNYPIAGPPLASGARITIERILTLTQLTDLRNQGGWFPETIEDALDRLTMQVQQLDADRDRTLRFPGSDPIALSGVLTNAESRVNKFLSFDVDGNPFISGGSIPGGVTVSVFAQTLLDDISAGDMFNTLGMSAFVQTLFVAADALAFRTLIGSQLDLLTTQGDLITRDASALKRLAVSATPEALLQSNTVEPVWGSPVPQGYRYGMEISRTGVYDVQIAVGVAKSSGNVWSIRRSAPITKKLSTVWAAGDTLGGRPAAVALTALTWYHVFIIFNAGTGVVDAGFDTSPTAANLLAAASGFLHYRRVGSVYTDTGPTDIYDFIQAGPWFYWVDPQSATYPVIPDPPVTLNLNIPLRVPFDVRPLAVVTIGLINSGVGDQKLYVSSIDQTNAVPSDTVTPLQTLRMSGGVNDPQFTQIGPIRVSTISEIRVRSDVNVTAFYYSTRGWYDLLP